MGLLLSLALLGVKEQVNSVFRFLALPGGLLSCAWGFHCLHNKWSSYLHLLRQSLLPPIPPRSGETFPAVSRGQNCISQKIGQAKGSSYSSCVGLKKAGFSLFYVYTTHICSVLVFCDVTKILFCSKVVRTLVHTRMTRKSGPKLSNSAEENLAK